jgi:ABC-2 type transport system permease protein
MEDSLVGKLINWLQLALAYVKFNFRSHLEYRGAFISQVVAMAVNDSCWIVFWTLFFTRFPVLHGWTQKDVMTIWAICASGFGLAVTFAGNSFQLARVVVRGELDSWLLYPRAVLPHLALGKLVPSGVGDAIFGYILFLFFVRPDLPHLALFLLFSLSAATLFIGIFALAGSLSFFVGNSEVLAEQWIFSLITFSTYPSPLFEGAVKILLFTLIPAGFISYLPVEALHTLCAKYVLSAIGGSWAFLAIGVSAFYLGLRRYESGNLINMQG